MKTLTEKEFRDLADEISLKLRQEMNTTEVAKRFNTNRVVISNLYRHESRYDGVRKRIIEQELNCSIIITYTVADM